MEFLGKIAHDNRFLRHGMFWLAWVFGFTFIKSFGYGLTSYAGWLVYYVVTLPLFVTHTYLIIYWAAPRFLSGSRITWFVLLFFVLMVLISFCEMVITGTLLSSMFPGVFREDFNFLDPLNVLVSGIGNLYIILVFAAAKMIRSWHVADQLEKQHYRNVLLAELADANAGIQPGMLLFSIHSIQEMTQERPGEVASAIALLSELLNSVMHAHKQVAVRLDVELRNVKKMLQLYAIVLLNRVPETKIEPLEVGDLGFPSFMVFSPLELLIRCYQWDPEDQVRVMLMSNEYVEIAWNSKQNYVQKSDVEKFKDELDHLFPGRYQVCLSAGSAGQGILIHEKHS